MFKWDSDLDMFFLMCWVFFWLFFCVMSAKPTFILVMMMLLLRQLTYCIRSIIIFRSGYLWSLVIWQTVWGVGAGE